MGVANIRIEKLELLLINAPDKLYSKELMSCERDISQLSDIIEDQYVGFGILASISNGKFDVEDVENTNNNAPEMTPRVIKSYINDENRYTNP